MFSVDELTDLEENTPEFAAATFVMALKKRDLRFLREISRRNFNTLFPSDDCSAAAKAKAKVRKLKKHADNSQAESVEEMVSKYKEKDNAENRSTTSSSVQEVVLQRGS